MPSENPTFSSTNPQFFKIILGETLKENKLRIPQCFVKKCGDSLTESVFLKLPCGSKWKMNLVSDDGKFWLQRGWPEFVKHYSIGRGHMITFRYDGNSEIYVVIFDINTVEIDYPATPVHVELRVPKREVIDDSVEILDDISSSPMTEVKSSCSQPSKRMKARSTGKLDSPSKSTDKSATKTTKKMNYRIPKIMKTLHKRERIAALQRTVGFRSEHPHFKMVMQPYYLLGKCMNFPHIFAKMHLSNRSYDVTLKVPNESKTWPVKYTYREHKSAAPRFQGGWRTFVKENNLKVGDVCVFVLLKAINNVSFEVVIFRAGESSKGSVGTTHNEAKRPRFLNSSSEKQDIGKQLPHTLAERVKIIEKDAIEHETPFFKIVIQQSNKWHVRVPLDMAEKHIKNDGDIVLAIPNGEQWPAQFKRRTSHITGKSAAVIFDGWKEFMTNNNLKVGDVCIFELLNKTELVFQVSIVRVSDFSKQQRSRAINSPEGENKAKGDERVKIEIDS